MMSAKQMTETPIRNFVQMPENIGTSGQPTRDQFAQIEAAKYTTVINLALPSANDAVSDEGAIVSGLGMRYIHIPVPFDNPTADHLRSFIRIMRALEGEKVWVHCVVNKRVSAFLYHYLRIEKGYDEASAKNALLKEWESAMEPVWAQFMTLSAPDIS